MLIRTESLSGRKLRDKQPAIQESKTNKKFARHGSLCYDSKTNLRDNLFFLTQLEGFIFKRVRGWGGGGRKKNRDNETSKTWYRLKTKCRHLQWKANSQSSPPSTASRTTISCWPMLLVTIRMTDDLSDHTVSPWITLNIESMASSNFHNSQKQNSLNKRPNVFYFSKYNFKPCEPALSGTSVLHVQPPNRTDSCRPTIQSRWSRAAVKR